jgi:hypothetical protein
MQKFYDHKLLGNLNLKWKDSRLKDQHMKHIYSLFMKESTTMEMLRMHKEMDDLKKEFMKEWRKLDLDVLISPVTPFTAILPSST